MKEVVNAFAFVPVCVGSVTRSACHRAAEPGPDQACVERAQPGAADGHDRAGVRHRRRGERLVLGAGAAGRLHWPAVRRADLPAPALPRPGRRAGGQGAGLGVGGRWEVRRGLAQSRRPAGGTWRSRRSSCPSCGRTWTRGPRMAPPGRCSSVRRVPRPGGRTSSGRGTRRSGRRASPASTFTTRGTPATCWRPGAPASGS